MGRVPKYMIGRQRFGAVYVEYRMGNYAIAQGLREIVLDHRLPTAHVDEYGGGLHLCEKCGVDEVLGVCGIGQGIDYVIGLRQEFG